MNECVIISFIKQPIMSNALMWKGQDRPLNWLELRLSHGLMGWPGGR